MLVRPVPTCASSWTPPPTTHRATTTSIVHQTKTPHASRHHKGRGKDRAKPRRPALRGGAPNMVVVDPANNTFGEVFTSSRIVEALGSLLNKSYESALGRCRLRGGPAPPAGAPW